MAFCPKSCHDPIIATNYQPTKDTYHFWLGLKKMVASHSSEIRSLCLVKCSCKMLENLSQFWNTKTHVVFSFRAALFFSLMNALVYVNIEQGIHYREKDKVAPNEKRKNQCGFLYSKSMANFEAFLWNIKLSANLLFMKSGYQRRNMTVCACDDFITSVCNLNYVITSVNREYKIFFIQIVQWAFVFDGHFWPSRSFSRNFNHAQYRNFNYFH